MKLADEAAVWHRLWSMRLMILTTMYTSAAGAWVVLPEDWKPHLPEWGRAVLAGVGVLLPGLAAVARIVKQQSIPPRGPQP